MTSKFKFIIVGVVCATIAACGGVAASTADDRLTQIDDRANSYKPFIPPWPSVELNHYEAAQKLYADPNTIQWCTTTFANPSSPLVTIPIAGKLTSSSVSFFPSSRVRQYNESGEYTPERRSIDGMYHGSPPPYRYGFTPGGQYVDFFNMPTFCTTQPLKFQRQKTEIALTVDDALDAATGQAETALKAGDKAGAQAALEAAIKGDG